MTRKVRAELRVIGVFCGLRGTIAAAGFFSGPRAFVYFGRLSFRSGTPDLNSRWYF